MNQEKIKDIKKNVRKEIIGEFVDYALYTVFVVGVVSVPVWLTRHCPFHMAMVSIILMVVGFGLALRQDYRRKVAKEIEHAMLLERWEKLERNR